jgi:hypothetical protein
LIAPTAADAAGLLALAELAERGTDALLGLLGLPFLAALLPLQPLHGFQKSHGFWLAINHGDRSFRVTPPHREPPAAPGRTPARVSMPSAARVATEEPA